VADRLREEVESLYSVDQTITMQEGG
jgi:hypothetical protein